MNEISGNARSGLFLNSGRSTVQGNIVTANGQEGILIDDKAYITGTNPGGLAVIALATPGTANQILSNQLSGNGDAGLKIDGGSANQIGSLGAGNVISGNRAGGILLNYTAATQIESNEIQENVASNGAGILAKCSAAAPVTHQVINNFIAANLATDAKGRGAGILLTAGCLAEITDNRIYANRNSSGTANLQNNNPPGSPVIDASNNLWDLDRAEAIEATIWHSNDDPTLGPVSFLPIGTGPVNPPPTPSPTPTAAATPLPQPTLTSTATPPSTGTTADTLYLPLVQR